MSDAEQKRLMLAYFTQPQEVGAQFEAWPQHMTIVPWFVAEQDLVIGSLRGMVKYNIHQPIKAWIGEIGEYGRGHAWEVCPTQRLRSSLHRPVLRVLKRADVDQERTKFIGDDYMPHISIKRNQPGLKEGQQLLIDHMAVVASIGQRRKRMTRQVVDIINFGDEEAQA